MNSSAIKTVFGLSCIVLLTAPVSAGEPFTANDGVSEGEVREYLSLFPESDKGATQIDKAEGERRRARAKDHLRARGFGDERKLLGLMDRLSRHKEFGSSGERLPRKEQSELARHSNGFAAAKEHLRNQVWQVSESDLQGLSEKYCRVLENPSYGDNFHLNFLVELDRLLQSAKPSGYLPKTRALRSALIKIAKDEPRSWPARAEAIKMLARRYSGKDIAPVLHAATQSEEIEIRKAAYFSLRKLPMTPEFLEQLEILYQKERARDPEAAYVLITTLRRFPLEDTPVILPVLSELRQQESNPFLVEKLEWAIWALQTEGKYEKKP